MKLLPEQVQAELKEFFGVEELTIQQAWFLAKYAKHCRLRCRNNAALNNFLGAVAPNLRFRQIPKVNPYNGKHYEGLEITDKTGKKILDDSE